MKRLTVFRALFPVYFTAPLLILCTACGGGMEFPNPDKWKVPGDEVALRGKVQKVVLLPADSGKRTGYVLFDAKGNITETNLGENFSGNLFASDIIEQYEYYANNHPKRKITRYPKNSENDRIDTFVKTGSRQYKKSGGISGAHSLWDAGEEESDSTAYYNLLTYDKQGFLVEEEAHRLYFKKQQLVKDEFWSGTRYENNTQGFPVKIRRRNTFEKEYHSQTRFYYSAFNTPDSIKRSDPFIQMWYEYNRFDKQGNIIEKRIKSGSPLLYAPYTFTYKYTFDKQGNWITRETVNDSARVIGKVQREIVYFE